MGGGVFVGVLGAEVEVMRRIDKRAMITMSMM